MPVLLLLAVGVFIWMLLTYRARQRTRFCRWRENRSRDTAEGRHFVCMACGAEAVSPDKRPPRTCLKPESPEP